GKTLQGISICELTGTNTGGVLLICPTGASIGWYDEITEWTDKKAVIVKGAKSKTKIKRLEEPADYKIINCESARYYQEYLLKHEWDAVILDEAHYVKNKKTILFEVLQQIKAKRKMFITANPTMNYVYELWAI